MTDNCTVEFSTGSSVFLFTSLQCSIYTYGGHVIQEWAKIISGKTTNNNTTKLNAIFIFTVILRSVRQTVKIKKIKKYSHAILICKNSNIPFMLFVPSDLHQFADFFWFCGLFVRHLMGLPMTSLVCGMRMHVHCFTLDGSLIHPVLKSQYLGKKNWIEVLSIPLFSSLSVMVVCILSTLRNSIVDTIFFQINLAWKCECKCKPQTTTGTSLCFANYLYIFSPFNDLIRTIKMIFYFKPKHLNCW